MMQLTPYPDMGKLLNHYPEDNLNELMRLCAEHLLLQNVRGTAPDL